MEGYMPPAVQTSTETTLTLTLTHIQQVKVPNNQMELSNKEDTQLHSAHHFQLGTLR